MKCNHIELLPKDKEVERGFATWFAASVYVLDDISDEIQIWTDIIALPLSRKKKEPLY